VPCGYAFSDGAWRPATQRAGEAHDVTDSLRLATMNVLFDSPKAAKPCSDRPDLLQHRLRYEKVLLELQQCNADVIALNEVSPFFLQMLQEQDWAKEHFTLSTVSGISDDGHFPRVQRTWGNVVLSRVPLLSIRGISTPKREAAVAVLRLVHGGRPLTMLVCSTHLPAMPLCRSRRANALRDLCDALHSDMAWDCAVVLGDFNFFFASESKSVPAGWHELPGVLAAGMTWDPTRNAMLSKYAPWPCMGMSLLPGFCWRMFSGIFGFRLDRVIVSSRSSAASINLGSTVALFADSPVGKGAPPYLFPSDHFGLVVTLCLRGHCMTD